MNLNVTNTPNFLLLPEEAAFLVFSLPKIKEDIQKKCDAIFLSSADEIQISFTDWIKEKVKDKTFSDKELNLNVIILSIWNKTKNRINDLIKIPKVSEDEYLAHLRAIQITEDLKKQGINGIVFTLRQSYYLLETAKKLCNQKTQ